jgi:uncharacterized membrane protein
MNEKRDATKTAFKLAISAVFAALVCVATLIFTVSVPATTGYFNVGETAIYVAALLFGPYVGAFAGGIGAAIADTLVAAQFAPGTLVIKACEGAIVGSLNKMFRRTSRSNWMIYTASLGIIVGSLLAITGSIYYSGDVQLSLGFPQLPTLSLTAFVPTAIWYFVGAIVALLIILMGFKIEPESGRAVFSMIVGGLEMAVGYFMYEELVLGKTGAIVEIPVNIGQMVIGLIVAIPIVSIVLRSLPQLKS